MPPAEDYAQRLQNREARVAACQKMHVRLGNIRLALAVVAVIVIWQAFGPHRISIRWILAPIAGFIAVAAYHSRVLRRRELAERALAFYNNGLARIEDRWAGTGQAGERFDDPHHVYASDLDLFGNGSLFQLLSTARTRMGEEALASWLLAPSPVEQITKRHAAVTELRDLLDLREDLAVLGEDAGVGVNPDALIQWAEASAQLTSAWIPRVAPVLAVFAMLAAFTWAYSGLATPFLLIVLIESVIAYGLRKPLGEVLAGAEHAFHDLDLLAAVLARVEGQEFRAPLLRELQESLRTSPMPASEAVAQFRSLVDLINSRENVFLRVLDVPLLYSVQVAFAAERWRRRHGCAMRAWLHAVGDVEALLSLSAYAYEHPEDPFPEFAHGEACFQAEGLGHPLLPAAVCVRNDVALGDSARVLLVSGSNMSGKSTLLRAAGLNTVLAMAGAPVRARRLRLTPLRVGASIRINDSLREGSSRFYAEIKRLRAIFDLARTEPPLLFLLDELLQGTNSNDRRIGARGVVNALVSRGSIGLVSTHDLSLTEIGSTLNGYLRNVHFQDAIEDGRMKFDYKLRVGVVTKSNGLELMRIIGLEV